MGEYWAVACKYWLINRNIVGKLNYLARCIDFNTIRVTSIRRLLHWALPQGQFWSRQIGNYLFQIIMNVIEK
jgi:hypothetical protein